MFSTVSYLTTAWHLTAIPALRPWCGAQDVAYDLRLILLPCVSEFHVPNLLHAGQGDTRSCLNDGRREGKGREGNDLKGNMMYVCMYVGICVCTYVCIVSQTCTQPCMFMCLRLLCLSM